LYVDAYDALRPYNMATLMITVTVLRNQNRPVWTFNVNNVNIREDKEPFTDVITVTAADTQDDVCSLLFLVLFNTKAYSISFYAR